MKDHYIMTTTRVDSMNMKALTIGFMSFALALLLSTMASATSYYGADPYDGVNRIGTYYQQSQTVAYNWEGRYQYYDYIAPARAGGWFGTGTEWLVGLRSPQYTAVPPVRFTNYYQPVCGWPCWTGGNGYQRPHAGDFPYRTRTGGVFNY